MIDSLHPLEQRCLDFIQSHRLATTGDRILVAVSGGMDSMVLLHLLVRLRGELQVTVTAGHVNHQLRGKESDEDETFVQAECAAMKIPCSVERVETRQLKKATRVSTQEAARRLRYDALERMRQSARAHSVATGHQADDHAETVLLNLLRGTGLRGLAGIPHRRDPGIIRPMLFARRSEIEQYAVERGIRYREDSSNTSLSYTRNDIRHTLLPVLENEDGDVVPSIIRIAHQMRDYVEKIDTVVDETMGTVVSEDPKGGKLLRISTFQELPAFLRDEILLRLLKELHVEPSAARVAQLHSLCSSQTGRHIQLAEAVSAIRQRDELVLGPDPMGRQPFDFPVQVGNRYDEPGFSFSAMPAESRAAGFADDRNTELVDGDRLRSPLRLRSWRRGDRFVPLGMSQSKKLSDFFIDQKVPAYEKPSIPILESGDAIVWVCGLRLDDRFKVTQSTGNVVQLTYHSQAQAAQ